MSFFPGKDSLVVIEVPRDTIDHLFLALFLTQFLVFLGGNAIARSSLVLEHSAWIAWACLQVTAVFYMIARLSGSFAWGVVATYGLMFFWVYGRFEWREEFGFVAGCAGLLYTVCTLRLVRSHIPAVFLMAGVASATCLTVESAYTSFDMLPRLYVGDLSQDTVFHASIAAMIKNYGVMSTGLNGVVETPYHALSHVLMGGLSLLSGQPVLEVYGVASYILFAPILILSITAVCVSLDERHELPIPLYWGGSAVLLWLLPRMLGSKWGVWDSYFVSESYMVSLGLFMAALPLLFKRNLIRRDAAFVLFAGLLIAHAKATVGIIYAGLWFSRILLLRNDGRLRGLEVFCFVLAAASASIAVLASAQAHSGDTTLAPLDFLQTYGGGVAVTQAIHLLDRGSRVPLETVFAATWQILAFFVCHFLLNWIVVSVASWQLGWHSLLKTPMTVYVVATMGVGVLALMVLRIPDGSIYYISNVAMFVALPSAIIFMMSWVYDRKIPVPLILCGALIAETIGGVHVWQGDVARIVRDQQAPKSELVLGLMGLRSAPLDQVYRYTEENIPAVSKLPCTARPFLFPAISEHPWIGVIKSQTDCVFTHYSYEQYGLSPEHQAVTIAPRLLAGMRVVDFNFMRDAK